MARAHTRTTKRERRLLAYHEAGHIVAARLPWSHSLAAIKLDTNWTPVGYDEPIS
jgi:hypothetical protein